MLVLKATFNHTGIFVATGCSLTAPALGTSERVERWSVAPYPSLVCELSVCSKRLPTTIMHVSDAYRADSDVPLHRAYASHLPFRISLSSEGHSNVPCSASPKRSLCIKRRTAIKRTYSPQFLLWRPYSTQFLPLFTHTLFAWVLSCSLGFSKRTVADDSVPHDRR